MMMICNDDDRKHVAPVPHNSDGKCVKSWINLEVGITKKKIILRYIATLTDILQYSVIYCELYKMLENQG
jgi:hypothetical protein